jgi:hypothetical protein
VIDLADLDMFTLAYIECALWSSNDNNEPLDSNYSIDDISPETLEAMVADCEQFQEQFGELIDTEERVSGRYGNRETAGHDFWLTRNGHGAGFWDGDWPEFGDTLTKAVGWRTSYPEVDLYVGDNGLIYCQ